MDQKKSVGSLDSKEYNISESLLFPFRRTSCRAFLYNEFRQVMPGPRPGWARAQLRRCTVGGNTTLCGTFKGRHKWRPHFGGECWYAGNCVDHIASCCRCTSCVIISFSWSEKWNEYAGAKKHDTPLSKQTNKEGSWYPLSGVYFGKTRLTEAELSK